MLINIYINIFIFNRVLEKSIFDKNTTEIRSVSTKISQLSQHKANLLTESE